MNLTDLANMLASSDVTVASGSLAQDVELKAALYWATANRLTLDAFRSISFDKSLTVKSLGSVTLVTNDGGSGGDYRFFGKAHIEFQNLKSDLSINGKDYGLVRTLKDLYRDVHRDPNGNYALAKSIDAIGTTYLFSPVHGGFAGNFEGLGNTISNLTILDPTIGDRVALFDQYNTSSSDPSNSIRDIGSVSVNIQVTAGNQTVGALVGANSWGTIKNSYASGQITANGAISAGGLVGSSELGIIENSYANVTVSSGAAHNTIGGLVGTLTAECSPCFGSLAQSYATGSVTGGDNAVVGGLIGTNAGAPISNSYATGSIIGGNNAVVGGLIGSNVIQEPTAPSVTSSYSIGEVSGGPGAIVGGFIGQDTTPPGISTSYWDLDTSGISDPSRGAGNISNDPGITGLSSTEFRSGLPSGFDSKVWKQKAGVNNGYPYLFAVPLH